MAKRASRKAREQHDREYAKEHGFFCMPGDDADARDESVWQYQLALERYERDGARGAYMQALFALGIDAANIRYLVANPGRGIAIMY